MPAEEKCRICSKKAKRVCPGTGGVICTSCCGSGRNSAIKCPPSCTHSPLSIAGYDLWLRIDAGLAMKILKYLAANYDRKKFDQVVKAMSLKDGRDEGSYENAVGLAAYRVFFVDRSAGGVTLADKWEGEGWPGLNNDEKVLMGYLRKGRTTVIEVQKVLDYQTMSCIDLLEPEKGSFVLLDRMTAARTSRFSRYLVWLSHYPYFSRTGIVGMEIPDSVYEEFMEDIRESIKEETLIDENFKIKDYLSIHFSGYYQFVEDLAREKRKAMLERMDLHQCVGYYEISGSPGEVEALLGKYPEFVWQDREPEEGDPDDASYYSWQRVGQSKAIEKKMNPSFRHDDESLGVGVLGNLTLYGNILKVEAFTRQKYEFAKKMIKKYFGPLLIFKREQVTDLAKQVAERPADDGGQRTSVPSSAIPPELERQVLESYMNGMYKKFIDQKLPMIDNMTPRQAAKEPKMRSKLLELMKIHIKGLEQQKRKKGTNISIGWLLDELGLQELK